MKKTTYIYFSVLALLFSAQIAEAQMFRGGLKGGITASEVSGDHAGGPDKLGWYASVYTNRDIGAFTRFQLELMYIQKGSRAYYDPWDDIHGNQNNGFLLKEDNDIDPDPDPDDGYRDYRFNLHYVEIPLFFIFDFASVTQLTFVDRLSGELGLSLSTVVGHYETDDNGNDRTELMASLRPFKFGELNIIAGMQYPITDDLIVHVRFSQGITPLRTRFGRDEVVCANVLECYRKRHQFNTVWSFGLSYTMFYGGN